MFSVVIASWKLEILNIVLCARKQTCLNPAVSWSSWQFISGQGTTFSFFSVFGKDLKSAVDEMPHRNIPAWEYVARGFLFNVGDALLPTSSNSLWCNSWPAHMNYGGPGGRQHLSKRCWLLSRCGRGVAGHHAYAAHARCCRAPAHRLLPWARLWSMEYQKGHTFVIPLASGNTQGSFYLPTLKLSDML